MQKCPKLCKKGSVFVVVFLFAVAFFCGSGVCGVFWFLCFSVVMFFLRCFSLLWRCLGGAVYCGQ